MPRHTVRSVMTGVLLAVTLSPTAAQAAPACANPVAPAPVETEVPWAQQRFGTERLASMATGADVTVAVVDSGVDRTHPQLRTQVVDGTDYLEPAGDGTRDCVGHGTAVASIIAATARDGVAFRGLAPQATILPVRVSEQQLVDGQESGRTVSAGRFAAAIRWAVDHGADVLNLSVVLHTDDPAVRASVAYAVDRDVVVVAAAGNLHDVGDPLPYPAAYDGVLGVGAITADGSRAPFSQTGPYVDVVAPGTEVLGAVPGRGHRRQNGTSYATPFATATAALIRQYHPGLSAAEVIGRIVATADPAPAAARDAYGAGVLNPYRAVADTGAAAVAPAPSALAAAPVDPARAAVTQRREHARQRAVLLGGMGSATVVVTVLLAAVLPRGARRRWRPASPD